MTRAVQLTMVAVLAVAAVIKSVDARPGSQLPPRGRSLSAWLAAGLWLLMLSNLVSQVALVDALDAATTTGVAHVLYNAANALGIASVLIFFFRSVSDERSARLTLVSASGVALAQALLMIATPSTLRGSSILSPGSGQPAVVGFYVVGGVWLVYAYFRCSLFALRFSRASRGALRGACILISVGFVLVALTSVVRIAIILLGAFNAGSPGSLRTVNSINFPVNNLAQVLAVLGLCVLGGLRLLDRRRRRRLFFELGPLHGLLLRTFPEIGLTPPPKRPAKGGYERRIVEVRDGLMRLSGPLNSLTAGRAPGDVSADEFADVVAVATTHQLEHLDAAVAPSPELLHILAGGTPEGGLDAGVSYLASVSSHLPRSTTRSLQQ